MNLLKEKNQISEEETSDNLEIEFSETEKGFQASFLIKHDLISKIRNTKLDLKKETIFKVPFLDRLKRKNNIFYYVSTKEMHVDIKDTTGKVYLPLITKEEINRQLQKMDSKTRSTIAMVHLGAVKILIKSEFPEGIDSPIKMALLDNRIIPRNDSILGAARGNLAYQKFMFTVYPKYAVSLNTERFDQILSFIHDFERKDLMQRGDKVFSITYLVAYALTNSHHSIDYKKKEYIELDDVFSEVGSVEDKQFAELTPTDHTWAIDIARNKPSLQEKPRRSFRSKNLVIRDTPNEEKDMLLKSMSQRINDLSDKFASII